MTAATEFCWVRSPKSVAWAFRRVRKVENGWKDQVSGTIWPEAVSVDSGHPDHESEIHLAMAYGAKWSAANKKAIEEARTPPPERPNRSRGFLGLFGWRKP